MAFENLRLAFKEAINCYRSGHKLDALSTFASVLWKGKSVKTYQAKESHVTDNRPNLKSSLAPGRNCLQTQEKELYERTVRENNEDPFLPKSEIRAETQGNYSPTKEPGEVQFDSYANVLNQDDTISTAPVRIKHKQTSQEEKNRAWVENTIDVLKTEEMEVFQQEIMASIDFRALLDLRDALIDRNDFTLEVENAWKESASIKLADMLTEHISSELVGYAIDEKEFAKLIKTNMPEQNISERLKNFILTEVLQIKPGYSYPQQKIEHSTQFYKEILEFLDLDIVMSQTKQNLREEADNADIIWKSLTKTDKTERKSLVEANDLWKDEPKKKN